mmetsp:Transcript_40324/g.105932  ORF Transcript_40324/g.105932 Transcript_40324/m.105932 type:complete len:255 (+) Transcript_40324:991-1755(+)
MPELQPALTVWDLGQSLQAGLGHVPRIVRILIGKCTQDLHVLLRWMMVLQHLQLVVCDCRVHIENQQRKILRWRQTLESDCQIPTTSLLHRWQSQLLTWAEVRQTRCGVVFSPHDKGCQLCLEITAVTTCFRSKLRSWRHLLGEVLLQLLLHNPQLDWLDVSPDTRLFGRHLRTALDEAVPEKLSHRNCWRLGHSLQLRFCGTFRQSTSRAFGRGRLGLWSSLGGTLRSKFRRCFRRCFRGSHWSRSSLIASGF